MRDEVARRASVADTVTPTTAVAERLGIPEPLVQTLLRRRQLIDAPGPTGSRLMYVLTTSVEAYVRRYPAPPLVLPSEYVVPVARVREILGLTRHSVTHLVCARRLSVISINRRQYVGAESLRRQLGSRPRDGALGLLAMYSQAQS